MGIAIERLDRVDRAVIARNGALKPKPGLAFFDPEHGLASLAKYLTRERFFFPGEALSVYSAYLPPSQDKPRRVSDSPQSYDKSTFEILGNIYRSNIHSDSNYHEQAGRRFYEKHFKAAIESINTLVDKYCPNDLKEQLDLPNDIQLVPSPEQILGLLASSQDDNEEAKRVRHSTSVVLTLALLSAELEQKTQPAEAMLRGVQHLFRTKLFGKSRDMTVHTLHNLETNEAEWATFTERGKRPEDVPMIPNTHLRSRHHPRMRYIDGVGYVIEEVRGKPNPIIKAIGKAIDNDKDFDPLSDVRDIAGVKFITQDEQSKQTLIAKVENLMEETYPGIKFVKKPNMGKKQSYQSGNFKVDGYLAEIPHSDKRQPPITIEFQFHTAAEHAHNSDHIGIWDNDERKYTGAAHDLIAAERAFQVLRAVFPEYTDENSEGIYTLTLNDENDGINKIVTWEDIRILKLHEIAKRKMNGHIGTETNNGTTEKAEPDGQYVLFNFDGYDRNGALAIALYPNPQN